MNSDFPKIITEQRKMRKISQKKAAEDLGVSQALLSHYEKGIRECGLDFVIKIADYYNLSCDKILGHSSNSNNGLAEDIEEISKTTEFLLTTCQETGGEELKEDMHSCIMLNLYKLLRMISQSTNIDSEDFDIPQIPAEDLTDSVIMNICASIKLKSSQLTSAEHDAIYPDSSIKNLIKSSENKISNFNYVCP